MSNTTLFPLLRAEHLWKIYPDGGVNAVADVTLSIMPGEYVAITGPSGCGKSTLLNLLGGLDQPTQGEVYFENQPLSRVSDLDGIRAEKIGFIFQSFYLLPTLTVAENVQVPMFEGRIRQSDRADRARELLELVGVGHRLHHLPTQLSVGERQRVAIARAMANDPIILLADEPTGNLDSHNAEDVLNLFDRLNRDRGCTIVMVTHAPECAARSSRVIRMKDGRVISDDIHSDIPARVEL